ncbi:MAG: TldD/PmbA family protein [Alphaproteobacteria bacterium]|nr:TldD/PmbA family protein [Alphaproteobacteria bacterium]
MSTTQHSDLIASLIEKAVKRGADAADAVHIAGTSLSASCRLGAPEMVERSEGHDIGLRVLVGKRQASVSTTDLAPDAIDELVERAVAMAKAAPEDPYCGLADPDQLVSDRPEIEMADPSEPSPETLAERARAVEDAARSRAGITNSDGGDAGWSRTAVTLAASNGFLGGYERTSSYISAVVIAGEGDRMQRDGDFSSAVFDGDLEDCETVGERAAQRTLDRLDPQRMPSARLPVLFEPKTARSLIGHLMGAISGPSITRGTSFLKEMMGERIFAEGIVVSEDPHRDRGFRSKPFDGEGLPTRGRNIIDDGALTTWLLDLSSSRQLGLAPTGHAGRGTSGPPSPGPTNLVLQPGPLSAGELIGEVSDGLYVTELMGMGVRLVTGDYSRSAAGFRIRDGKLAEPVADLTLAGNLKEVFASLTPANDLDMRGATFVPTVRVEGLTIGGGE